MESTKDQLLQEAKKQGVLRIGGIQNLTIKEALKILQMFGSRVREAQFPECKFWMLK